MTEQEYRTAWIEAEYLVTGWWKEEWLQQALPAIKESEKDGKSKILPKMWG